MIQVTLLCYSHELNLRSNMLSPDVYWYRGDLETLYADVTKYFSVSARATALNNQLNYCTQTLDTLDGLHSHRHSSLLEKIIIWLIMAEVLIELSRWYCEHKQHQNHPVTKNGNKA